MFLQVIHQRENFPTRTRLVQHSTVSHISKWNIPDYPQGTKVKKILVFGTVDNPWLAGDLYPIMECIPHFADEGFLEKLSISKAF